jgi:hypothetical protein
MKKKMFLLLSLLLLILVEVDLLGQERFDTARVILTAKINLIDYATMSVDNDVSFDKENLLSYINIPLEYEFLDSKGFDENVVFFKIKAHKIVDTANKIWVNDSTYQLYNFFANVNYDFIFGYNLITNELYRLKGLPRNDFYRLYKFLLIRSSFSMRKILRSKRKFVSYFWVDGLDMKCLYEVRTLRKFERKMPHKKDCIRPAQYIF